VDDKLRSIDSCYQLLQHDQTNRWMLILEATILALFILDVVLILLEPGAKWNRVCGLGVVAHLSPTGTRGSLHAERLL